MSLRLARCLAQPAQANPTGLAFLRRWRGAWLTCSSAPYGFGPPETPERLSLGDVVQWLGPLMRLCDGRFFGALDAGLPVTFFRDISATRANGAAQLTSAHQD